MSCADPSLFAPDLDADELIKQACMREMQISNGPALKRAANAPPHDVGSSGGKRARCEAGSGGSGGTAESDADGAMAADDAGEGEDEEDDEPMKLTVGTRIVMSSDGGATYVRVRACVLACVHGRIPCELITCTDASMVASSRAWIGGHPFPFAHTPKPTSTHLPSP